MVNAQQWLDQEYPLNGKCLGEFDHENKGKGREEIKNLDISRNNTYNIYREGNLRLEDFTNLKSFSCMWNGITKLDLTDCPDLVQVNCTSNELETLDVSKNLKLEGLYCNLNRLTNIVFPESGKLTHLHIKNNKFNSSLEIFRPLTELIELTISTENKEGTYDRFWGTLESLSRMSKLNYLEIPNTDIDRGLEYLPKTVKQIKCSNYRKDAKCAKIAKQLENYKKGRYYYYQDWRKDNKNSIEKTFQEKWAEIGFTDEEIKHWIENGLEINEWDFAGYCKKQSYSSENANIKRLRNDYLQAQFWLDYNYPKEKRSEITKLDISEKKLTGKLKLKGFINLTKLDCSQNSLTKLDLSDCSRLTGLCCSDNQLSNCNWLNNLPKPERLTVLDIKYNSMTGNLTPLSKLVNLKRLNLNASLLFGSLSPLQKCSQLERLDIRGTSITAGLEYLPLSLQEINCDGTIRKKLILYHNNLIVWQVSHPELMQKAGKDLVVDNNDYNKSELKIVLTNIIKLNQKSKLEDNHQLTNLKYSKFILRNYQPFSWETTTNNSLKETPKLPIKLYHIKNNQVVWTENTPDINSYAIMSYVWGDLSDQSLLTTWDYSYQNEQGESEAKQMGVSEKNKAYGTTKWSIKALTKAIATCKLLNIDYLWMDQICIDQFDNEEQGQEVTKMRQYYGNAIATLITIDAEIGKIDKEDKIELVKSITQQIISSSWFQRSWTFQEGLLSRQTIFMFDNTLVDGRILAQHWGEMREEGTYWGSTTINLKTAPTIFITPLGWNYVAKRKQPINLTLSQALSAVEHRQQTVPLDGIYSILGLLPYGEQVKPKYKKFDESYTKEELSIELKKVMKIAQTSGAPYETISWLGSRLSEPKLWLFPPIKDNGSSEVTGFVEFNTKLDSIKILDRGLECIGYKEIANAYNVEKGIKEVGDIVIRPLHNKLKGAKQLEIIVPRSKKNVRTVIFKDCNYSYGKEKLFIDMINKELITGKKWIEQYHNQLPKIHQYAQVRNQTFILVYDSEGDNQTFDNSLIWQIEEKFYIMVAEQLKEVISEKNQWGKHNNWQCKVVYQTQIQAPPKNQ